MVNRSRRLSGAGSSRSTSPAKVPKFFKIIDTAAVRYKKLRIPRKFVSEYGNKLANLVFLKVPSGAVWRVELMNFNGDVWFCKGWKEFAEHYKLGFGHFLMFGYEGNSYFHVVIIDKSATEIEYPFTPCHGGQTDEDLDGYVQKPKAKDVKGLSKEEHHDGGTSAAQRHQYQPKNDSYKSRAKKLKSEALERAGYFKAEKPFFVVYMHPTYISGKSALHVPRKFVRKYWSTVPSDVWLRTSDGQRWSARCRLYEPTPRCLLTFTPFVRDNGLRTGDVCVFELVNGVGLDITLNVTTYRNGNLG
ncbi:hypothetical protein NMG60_11026121 [Bertholletia excelsa]